MMNNKAIGLVVLRNKKMLPIVRCEFHRSKHTANVTTACDNHLIVHLDGIKYETSIFVQYNVVSKDGSIAEFYLYK